MDRSIHEDRVDSCECEGKHHDVIVDENHSCNTREIEELPSRHWGFVCFVLVTRYV
jgi:hypothetical protein